MLLNDRYRVIRTLGSGGFGETYLAEDSQMPSNRRCVIKQLRAIENNPQIYQLVQERFQREAAILEDLGSASDQIPTLYAYFQANGIFYVVQELIEGDTLTTKFQQQGLFSESAIREILINLLPVLEYVHSKHIVHRDIKPDNIIIRHRDHKPVLIDFGAVRESMGTVMNSQGQATSSIVIGTPGFMPSEQAAGRPVYSSDLYSLGMTAIYLLTGKQPQELETDTRSGEIVWHQYALNVSPTLASILDKAIAYHPRERYTSAREMLDALLLGSANSIPTVPYNQAPVPPTQPSYNQTPVPPTQPSYNQTPVPPTQPSVQPQNSFDSNSHNSFQPNNQNSQNQNNQNSNGNQKGIVIASVVASGLIGAAVIIGIAINRSSQPVADANNSLQTSPNSQQTPEPTPSETPVNTVVSPEQGVRNFYTLLNQGQYQAAWDCMSPSLQNNQTSFPKGYLSFADFFAGNIQRTDIEKLTIIEQNSDTATVDAQLNFFFKNGSPASLGSIRFSLLWDATNRQWIINNYSEFVPTSQ
jgi:serine/threonine-protein kinase